MSLTCKQDELRLCVCTVVGAGVCTHLCRNLYLDKEAKWRGV